MATYKEIKGQLVQTLTADPPTAIAQGEMWYRSDIDQYKMGGQLGAWSAGGVAPGPFVALGGGGTATAAWISSGQGTSPAPPNPTATYFYNGTAWSDQSAAVTNNTWYMGSTGTQAAALMGAGGNPVNPGYNYTLCEEWGGSSWSVITAIPSPQRRYCAGFGTATTACIISGTTIPSNPVTDVDLWNGTSWSAEANCLTGRSTSGGCGLETTGIFVGSGNPTEEYNGTSWAQGAAYPNPTSGVTNGGTSAACVAYGGNPDNTSSNSYDGTAWSAQGTMSDGRQWGASSDTGTTSSQLATCGGSPAGNIDKTEEYTLGDAIKTVGT